MNCLWPTIARFSCQNPRLVQPIYHSLDSISERSTISAIRHFSQYSTPFRRSHGFSLNTRPSKRAWQARKPAIQIFARYFGAKRIITEYNRLPKDYKDREGLDFRETPLSAAEVKETFGPIVDVNTANAILKVLHGRRVAGTLDDPSLNALASGFEIKVRELGLEWLREHVPVDEVESAGRRAELELAEMDANIISDAERWGLYKPRPGQKTKTGGETVGEPKSVYGDSVLDQMRRAKAKEFAEGAAERRKKAAEIRKKTGTLGKVNNTTIGGTRKPSARLQMYLDRAKILPDTPIEMSKFARLWPSALFTLAVVGACVLFAQYYTPPAKSTRMWPDMPPSAATIIGLICANAIILLLWRIPPAFRFLNKNFITFPGHVYPQTLLGNTFSHQTVPHYASNMVLLWFVGTRLHDEIGRGNFLAVYISTGVLGSMISLTHWVTIGNLITSSLGASGALCGIVACYLWLHRSDQVTFFGMSPENWPSISSLTLFGLLVGMEILAASRIFRVGILKSDHWAHLGGYLSGVGAAELLRLRYRRRAEREAERRKNMGFVERIKEGKF